MSTPKVLRFSLVPSPEPQSQANPRVAGLPVVSVGRDPVLLRLREQILSEANVAVLSLSPEEAEPEARMSQPRLWVFCSTVEFTQLIYLACNVRCFSPESRLLLLQGMRPVGSEARLFHRILDPEESIDNMLRIIIRLTSVA
jgi:hypothetical protein